MAQTENKACRAGALNITIDSIDSIVAIKPIVPIEPTANHNTKQQ